MRIKSKLCVKFVWLFIVESKKQHLGADTLHYSRARYSRYYLNLSTQLGLVVRLSQTISSFRLLNKHSGKLKNCRKTTCVREYLVMQFLDPTGSLAFTFIVGWLVGNHFVTL